MQPAKRAAPSCGSSDADLFNLISASPGRYSQLDEAIRRTVSVGMFRVALASIRRHAASYKSWLARDPVCVPKDHPDREELLAMQREGAAASVTCISDIHRINHIPDAVLKTMTAGQLDSLLRHMYIPDRGEVTGTKKELRCKCVSRIVQARPFQSEWMLHVAREYPFLYHHMDRAYRTYDFITTLVQPDVNVLRQINHSIWADKRDDDLLFRLAEYAALRDIRTYVWLPQSAKYSARHAVRSVRLALAALANDILAYRYMPPALRRLGWTAQDAAWVTPLIVDPNFRRYFVVEGLPFALAAARAAFDRDVTTYEFIPTVVITRIDELTGHGFTRSALRERESLVSYVPFDNLVFADRSFCRMVLKRYGPSLYLKFPEATQADYRVVQRINLSLHAARAVIAAVPTATMLDRRMPHQFMITLKCHVTAQQLLLCNAAYPYYAELMYSQPLVLRVLNGRLFYALMQQYYDTYMALKRWLGKSDLCAHICRLVFGDKHMARLKLALCYKEEVVERMRQNRGLCDAKPTGGRGYRSMVRAGVLSVFPKHALSCPHPDWVTARLNAYDHGPELDAPILE